MRREVTIAIILAIVASVAAPLIPAIAGPAGQLAPQASPIIPDINKEAFPNPAVNIGPGFPEIVYGQANFTVLFKENLAGTPDEAYLLTVALINGSLELIKYNVSVEQVSSDEVRVVFNGSNVKPGLYDLVIRAGNDTIIVPRSVWVVDPTSLAKYFTFEHISDLHFGAGQPDPTIGQYRRFVGYLTSQLLGVTAILNTGDEADTQAASQYLNSLAYRYDFAYTVPMFLNPGNHDYPNSNFYKYYGRTVNYAVILGKILIVALNTDGERGYLDSANLTFLRNVLEEHKDVPIKIVMFHHPVFYYQGKVYTTYNTTSPIISNPHQNRDSIVSYYWGANLTATRELLKLVEEYNVTMVLAGHIHRDQYVEYHSTWTGHVTYFQTTTTLAHGTGTYQGLQVVRLNLSSGVPEYPYAPPWFIGYKNYSRTRVYNSIPVTLPEYAGHWQDSFGRHYYYGYLKQGRTAIVMALENTLPTLSINRTAIISLPWPDGYPANMTVLAADNASARLIDTLYVKELHRMFFAIHFNLPPYSYVKIALYTEPDNDTPQISLKYTLPRKPTINRTVKAYIQVSDAGWGIDEVNASITTDRGEVQGFKFEHYSGDIYLATFKVVSKYRANVTITVEASDFAGHRASSQIEIALNGPVPPRGTTSTSTTTTTSSTTTSPETSTTSPAGTATSTTAGGGAAATTQGGAGTSTTGASQSTTSQGGGTSTTTIAAAVIIVIVIIGAGLALARR